MMLEMTRVALPVFVMVTGCDALVVPTAWLPNNTPVPDRETTGRVPVPLSEICCGEPTALSVIVTVALLVPATVGVKCPWMVQLAPAVRFVPQLLAKTNEEAPVPVTAMLLINSVAAPEFVIVTDCDALVVPSS
jgi:hypothetical protein